MGGYKIITTRATSATRAIGAIIQFLSTGYYIPLYTRVVANMEMELCVVVTSFK